MVPLSGEDVYTNMGDEEQLLQGIIPRFLRLFWQV